MHAHDLPNSMYCILGKNQPSQKQIFCVFHYWGTYHNIANLHFEPLQNLT